MCEKYNFKMKKDISEEAIENEDQTNLFENRYGWEISFNKKPLPLLKDLRIRKIRNPPYDDKLLLQFFVSDFEHEYWEIYHLNRFYTSKEMISWLVRRRSDILLQRLGIHFNANKLFSQSYSWDLPKLRKLDEYPGEHPPRPAKCK